jgi:hypothetical protein
MAIDPNTYYRTVTDADAYFAEQLYARDWTSADPDDKDRAMLAATRSVDSLKFAGMKKAVYDLLEANPDATADEIQAAYDSQLLQFPRDTQDADTVPDDIFWAVCEEAMSRLSGKDPAQEFENLTLTSENVGGTRVSSDRSQMPPQHIANFITSATAWRYLQRWLDENNNFDHRRVS